jgi:RNA polymerase sigma-70 factor (ECF subfamily)
MALGEFVIVEQADGRAEVTFDQLFRDYHQDVYHCAYRMLGDSEEAADVAQDTFVRAYRALPKLERDLRPGPWLYRIATNLCLDRLRRRKLIRWEPWDVFSSVFHPRQVARENPEREVVQAESHSLLRQALGRLSARHRQALFLREEQGLSCDEIGESLGISRQAAKSLLFRAREELREQYVALGGEP